MADIELVIKIPEDSYKATCNGWMLPPDVENVVQGIKNGTPLPKGHGDLKDQKDFDESDCIRRSDIGLTDFEIVMCNGDYKEALKMLLDKIEKASPVIPQSRKGHWISHWERCKKLGVTPSGLSAYAWCSNCDCALDVGEWHRNHYNYCPNCGADMREVKNDKRRDTNTDHSTT